MTISELEGVLTVAKAVHGDIEVRVDSQDEGACYGTCPIDRVRLVNLVPGGLPQVVIYAPLP